MCEPGILFILDNLLFIFNVFNIFYLLNDVAEVALSLEVYFQAQ